MTVFRQRESINVSHVIHSVSFGEPYRGMVNPLDNQPKIIHEGSGYFQYYIKVLLHTYYRTDYTHSNYLALATAPLPRRPHDPRTPSRSCPPSTSTLGAHRC